MNPYRAPLPWTRTSTAMAGPVETTMKTASSCFHFILEVRLSDGTLRRLLPTQLLDQRQQIQQQSPPPMLNFAYPSSSHHHFVPALVGSSQHRQSVPTTLESALRQLHESQLPIHLWNVKQVEFVGVVKERHQYDVDAPKYSVPLRGVPLSQIITEDDCFVVTPSSGNPLNSLAKLPALHATNTARTNTTPPPIITSKASMDICDILFDMLSKKQNADIISWRSDGSGFVVHDKKRFASEIIPRYFPGTRYGYRNFFRRLRKYGYINEPTSRSNSNQLRKLARRQQAIPHQLPSSLDAAHIQQQQKPFLENTISTDKVARSSSDIPILPETKQLGHEKQWTDKGQARMHLGRQNQSKENGASTVSLGITNQTDGAMSRLIDLTADAGEIEKTLGDKHSKVDNTPPIEAKSVNGKASGKRGRETADIFNLPKNARTGEESAHGSINEGEKPELHIPSDGLDGNNIASASIQQFTALSGDKQNPFYRHLETQTKKSKPRITIRLPTSSVSIATSSPIKRPTENPILVTSSPAAGPTLSTSVEEGPHASVVTSSLDAVPSVAPSAVPSEVSTTGSKFPPAQRLDRESSDRIKSYKDLLYFAKNSKGPSAE